MNCWESQILDSISKCDTETAISLIKQGFPINYSIKLRDGLGTVQPGYSTLLIEGILSSNLEFCKFLLESGSNPNTLDSKGRHPGHVAALVGNIEIFQLLYNYSSDFSIRDAVGNTVLHIAATGLNLNIVKYLVESLCFPVVVTNKMMEKPLDCCKSLQDEGKTLMDIERLEEIILYLWKSEEEWKKMNFGNVLKNRSPTILKAHRMCRPGKVNNDEKVFPVSIFPFKSHINSNSPFKARQTIQTYLKDKHAAILKTLENAITSSTIPKNKARSPSPTIRLPQIKKPSISTQSYY